MSDTYVDRDTGEVYVPHSQEERDWVYRDVPRYAVASDDERGTVAGIIKALDRVRRGMSGIIIGSSISRVRYSMWPEFQRRCPWDRVIERYQTRGHSVWKPHAPFRITFKNDATLIIGGLDNPKDWRGHNVSFAFLNEIAAEKIVKAIKIFDGCVRVPGPDDELPQLFFTLAPEISWLFRFYHLNRERFTLLGGGDRET